MMSAKRKISLAVLLLVVALSTWFLAIPMVKFSTARKKYVLGMSLEQAQRIAKAPFETDFAIPYNTLWSHAETPEPAKRMTVIGLMYCPKECVILGFNWYSNLVEIQPVNDPIDFRLWLR